MPENTYERPELLAQYLNFHYGRGADMLPWDFGPKEALHFPVRCVQECLDLQRLPERVRALDVGCAVGRSTLELSRYCAEAIGVDFSHTFIMAASLLCREGTLAYDLPEVGGISRRVEARLPEGIDCTGISFRREDAQALPADLGRFDVVLAANLLCRLPYPQKFLERLPDLLNGGGQLIITTPNTWLETFTARDYWIGATPETGEPLEALKKILEPNFIFEGTRDLPFLIREHVRKFQWSVAQASMWTRRTD
jgi:putative 4-mercaptohistidine N1-methyltranferase